MTFAAKGSAEKRANNDAIVYRKPRATTRLARMRPGEISSTIGWSGAEYAAWVRTTFGGKAERVLAEYPWPADPGRFTGAYLSAEVLTDSAVLAGLTTLSSPQNSGVHVLA